MNFRSADKGPRRGDKDGEKEETLNIETVWNRCA